MTLWLHTWSIKMVADMNFVHLFFICWSDFFSSLAIKNQISLGGCQRQLGDSLIKKNYWRDISPIFLDEIIYVLDLLWSVWCECPRAWILWFTAAESQGQCRDWTKEWIRVVRSQIRIKLIKQLIIWSMTLGANPPPSLKW